MIMYFQSIFFNFLMFLNSSTGLSEEIKQNRIDVAIQKFIGEKSESQIATEESIQQDTNIEKKKLLSDIVDQNTTAEKSKQIIDSNHENIRSISKSELNICNAVKPCINRSVEELINQNACIERFVKELNTFTKDHSDYANINNTTQTLLSMDRNNKIMLFYKLLELKNLLMEAIDKKTQDLLTKFIKTISIRGR